MDKRKLGYGAVVLVGVAALFFFLAPSDERTFKKLLTEKYEKRWGQYLNVTRVQITDVKQGGFMGQEIAEVEFEVDLSVHTVFTGCLVVSSSAFCLNDNRYETGLVSRDPTVTFGKYKSGWRIE